MHAGGPQEGFGLRRGGTGPVGGLFPAAAPNGLLSPPDPPATTLHECDHSPHAIEGTRGPPGEERIRKMTAALAINGGEKAVKTKLPGWPHFSEKAIRAVEAVLRSGKVNYWTGTRRAWSSRSDSPSGREQVRHQRGHRHGGAARRPGRAGHRARRRGDRAQLHLHRHQLLRRAGRRHPALRRREPRRPLHQRRVGREAGHRRAPRPSCPCTFTATSATWTRSTPSPRSTSCSSSRTTPRPSAA